VSARRFLLSRAGPLRSRLSPDPWLAGRLAPLSLALAGVALACVVSILWLDRSLALFMRARVEGDWQGFWQIVTDLGSGTHWYLLVVAAWAWCRIASAGALFHDDWARRREHARAWLLLGLGGLLASGLLITVMKWVIGRLRPSWLFNEDVYAFAPLSFLGSANSFPSGHSQTIWAIMTALMIMFPRHWPTWAGVGVLVAASRLFVGKHFLSDVLAGSTIGAVTVLLLAAWAERRGWRLRIGKPR